MRLVDEQEQVEEKDVRRREDREGVKEKRRGGWIRR